MKENKFENPIPDKELDQVNGGMKIIIPEMYTKIREFLEKLLKKNKKLRQHES